MSRSYGTLVEDREPQQKLIMVDKPLITQGSIERSPPEYIGLSVFTMVLCCCPFGLAALYHAFNVEARFGAGDVVGARSASRRALVFSVVGIILGCLVIIAAVTTVLVLFV